MHAAAGVLSHRVRVDFAQVALNPCAQWNGWLASRVLPLKSWIAILHSKISLLRPIVLNPLSAEAVVRAAGTARGRSAARTQPPCLVYSFRSATQWTCVTQYGTLLHVVGYVLRILESLSRIYLVSSIRKVCVYLCTFSTFRENLQDFRPTNREIWFASRLKGTGQFQGFIHSGMILRAANVFAYHELRMFVRHFCTFVKFHEHFHDARPSSYTILQSNWKPQENFTIPYSKALLEIVDLS